MSTSVFEYLENIEDIQERILTFIEDENNKEENYQNILRLFEEQKILDSPSETKLILTLISKISDNHFRVPNFFSKIEQILLFLKDSITKNLSNYDIFTIFSNNKRLILFFLKEGIIKFDIDTFNNLIKNKKSLYDITSPNLKYFLPEIKTFIETLKVANNNKEEKEEKKEEDEDKDDENEDDEDEDEEEKTENNNIYKLLDHINQLYQEIVNDDFEKKRNLGENDDNICQLIQKDMIEEFIIEYNKTNFSLKMKIPTSFYETNPFLLTKTPTLIEYASFYGSTQIFRFLFKNKVTLTKSLWIYAIHSDNSELISILEEKCPKPESFKEVWIEAVKCHHNSMANYFQDNYSVEICYKFFSFFNISIFKNNNINREITFYYACKYDYYNLCKILLSTTNVNINYYKSTWIDEIDTIDIGDTIFDYEIKRRLISKKTPFAAACQNHNIDIINLLLSNNKIDINLPNIYINKEKEITKNSPLYLSLVNNKLDIVKLLLSRPEIDVNFGQISANVFQSALCLAIRQQNIELIKLLLSNPKIDVNIPLESNTLNQTALCLAVELQNIEIIKLLLSDPKIDVNVPSKSNKLNQTALYLAVELQNIEIIKLLLSNPKIDVNIECDASYDKHYISHRTPLSLAVELGRSDIVDLILENGNVDINEMNLFSLLSSDLFGAEKKSLLYIAIENEQLEVAKILLKNKDIDVNALNHICREDGDFDYYRENNCKSYDFIFLKSKKTALHIAVQNKLVEYVELLLSDPRTDANILSELFDESWCSGSTDYNDGINDVVFYHIYTHEITSSSSVLDIALDNNDIEMFKFLLSHPKIDVNILSKSNDISQTVLHRAVYEGKVEMVELLLSHPKIDVNIPQTKKGYSNTETKTALHIAYQRKNQNIINLLLKRNDINVDALDYNGKKPSYYENNKSYYRW